MKRKLILLNVIVAVILIFAASAYAIFCQKCGANNPDDSIYCIKCGAKLQRLEKGNIYDNACDLLSKEEYDQAISTLTGYCASNPQDKKSQILLAKAYLRKCDLLKEQDNKQYKTLVYKPFEIGKQIIVPRDQYLSEGLYICGWSFLINHRSYKAARYIRKAIKLSKSPPAEYFIALGDAQFTMAKNEDPTGEDEDFNYPKAKKTYKKVINMKFTTNEKGKAYYKLGVLHLYLNEKKDARQAFESALQFAKSNSLISRIRSKLGSL